VHRRGLFLITQRYTVAGRERKLRRSAGSGRNYRPIETMTALTRPRKVVGYTDSRHIIER
jgi:hypothetical protein